MVAPRESTVLESLSAVQAYVRTKGSRLAAVLFAETQPRMGTYVPLAEAIREQGHLAIIVYPHELPSMEEFAAFTGLVLAPIPARSVRSLTDVDVFFSPEVVHDIAPPGAATVAIPHSLPDASLSAEGLGSHLVGLIYRYPQIIRSFDYLVAALREPNERWTEEFSVVQDVYPAELLGDRKPTLDIVPGGYPSSITQSASWSRISRPAKSFTRPHHRTRCTAGLRWMGNASSLRCFESSPISTSSFGLIRARRTWSTEWPSPRGFEGARR